VLGIDAGERRVGVAMSDELRLLASPVAVLDRRPKGLAPVLDSIRELVRREDVRHVVVGLPLNADGSEGAQARRARDFARVAERVVGIPVTMWDERLSTREAEAIVRAQGRNLRRVRRRGELDAVAAAAILQDYLDHHRQAKPST
jgi:putative Holliday junction resolvase